MKKLLLIFPLFFLSLQIAYTQAQSDAEQLIHEGIELYDAGKYEQALQKYKNALALDAKNYWAMYEMALTYQALEKEDRSVSLLKTILKKSPRAGRLEAYILLGAIYDDFGKSQKAYKLYQKGLEEFPRDHMLHFNAGVTAYRMDRHELAEEHFTKALEINNTHPTSWLHLAYLRWAKGQKPHALLALSSFLLLEPNSKRSEAAFASLWKLLHEDVIPSEDGDITINLSPGSTTVEGMLFLAIISGAYTEANPEEQPFDWLLAVLQGFSKAAPSLISEEVGIWAHAAQFFLGLNENNHIEAFCHYISLTQGEEHGKWLEEHADLAESFYDWAENNW